jgi:hypothetical protein
VLSRRWANLLREVLILDLRVTDAIPQGYRRGLLRRGEASSLPLLQESSRRLNAITGPYEQRNMVASVKGLILASRAAHRRRRVNKLSLEVLPAAPLPGSTAWSWMSLIAGVSRISRSSGAVDVVDSRGVKDLEVVGANRISATCLQILPWHQQKAGRVPPVKPQACQLPAPAASGVHRAHHALIARLLPNSTPVCVYEGVVAGPQLQVLHLLTCRFERLPTRLVFDRNQGACH